MGPDLGGSIDQSSGSVHRLGKNGKKFVCHIVRIIFCTFCTEMW